MMGLRTGLEETQAFALRLAQKGGIHSDCSHGHGDLSDQHHGCGSEENRHGIYAVLMQSALPFQNCTY